MKSIASNNISVNEHECVCMCVSANIFLLFRLLMYVYGCEEEKKDRGCMFVYHTYATDDDDTGAALFVFNYIKLVGEGTNIDGSIIFATTAPVQNKFNQG